MKKAKTQRFWSANPIRAAFCREGYGVTILLIICTNHWAAVEFGLAIGIAVKSTWEQRSQLKGLSDWSYKLVMLIFHHWAHYIRIHKPDLRALFSRDCVCKPPWSVTSPDITKLLTIFATHVKCSFLKESRQITAYLHVIDIKFKDKNESQKTTFSSPPTQIVEDPGSSTFQHWIQTKNGSPQWWQKSVYTWVPSRLTVGTRHTCGCFLHKGNLRSSVHIHLSHLHSCLQFHTGKLLNVGSIAWDKHPSMQYCGGNSTLLAPEAS